MIRTARTPIFSHLALALILAGVSGQRAGADEPAYSRRVWSSQDGLPQDRVYALAQSRDGYLWIGTSGGLARFDGVRFRVFNRENTPELHEESILAIYSANDGALWIGTEGGGLVRYQDGKFERFSEEQGLTNGFVRAISEDLEGRLWAGTDRGLFLFEDGLLRRIDDSELLPAISVHAFHRDSHGRFWVAGAGFRYFDGDRFAHVPSKRGLVAGVARDMTESAEGELWAATVGGLFRAKAAEPETLFDAAPALPTATSVIPSRAGGVWAGGRGLYHISKDGIKAYEAPRDLPDDHILALFEDREGNLWVGTDNGLLRMSRSVARTIPAGEAGGLGGVKTIYEDRDEALWMTTLSGGLYRYADGAPRRVRPADGAVDNYRMVYRDRAGGLWAGTHGQGAWRFSGGRIEQYAMRDGLINNFIRAFAETRDGSLWIGTDSGLSRLRDGKFQNFYIEEGLAYGSVRTLLEDRRGSLWVGTDRGVSRFADEKLFREPRLEQLADEKVWAIHEDPDGGLWFGTRGAGLFLLDGEKVSRFGVEQGLASDSIHHILEGENGMLWLSGPSGVCTVRRGDLLRTLEDPRHRPAVTLYGASEGLETDQISGGLQPGALIAADGSAWFPSTRGAVRVSPELREQTDGPPVLIERVLADGEERPLAGDELVVGPGTERLEIQYTAIRLGSSERIRFRYRLEGFETSWNEVGGRREAYYTNIPPGSYRFVVAAYESGEPRYAKQAALDLRLLPRFYESSWFLTLCAVTTVGLAVGGYRLRVRQIRGRFAAVLAERNRLAREMHDTLIQGCVGVAALLDAAASLADAAPKRSTELTEQARGQIRASVNEARRAVWNLRNSSADGAGLTEALGRLAQQISKVSGVPITFETTGKPVRLDPQIEHDLVMIAREAMLNAVRHGEPQTVAVHGSFEPGRVRMEVRDDGCGFDPAAVSENNAEHFGVLGMAERAGKIGGKLAVDSEPGRGARVTVDVVLKARGSEQ